MTPIHHNRILLRLIALHLMAHPDEGLLRAGEVLHGGVPRRDNAPQAGEMLHEGDPRRDNAPRARPPKPLAHDNRPCNYNEHPQDFVRQPHMRYNDLSRSPDTTPSQSKRHFRRSGARTFYIVEIHCDVKTF